MATSPITTSAWATASPPDSWAKTGAAQRTATATCAARAKTRAGRHMARFLARGIISKRRSFVHLVRTPLLTGPQLRQVSPVVLDPAGLPSGTPGWTDGFVD